MFKHLIVVIVILITSTVSAQSDFAVGLNGSINFPTGQFANFNTGGGGDVHFLYLLGNSTILSFAVGYNGFSLDVDRFNEKAKELGINAKFDVDSKFSIIPILLGAKWYFLQSKKQNIYLMLEAGIYNYQFTFKGMAYLINLGGNGVPIELPEFDENGTKTLLRISAGYVYFLGKHWFVDASVSYIVLTNAFAVNEPVNPEDPDAIYGVVGTLNYISALAGINYRF
jgi:hypothetical protein